MTKKFRCIARCKKGHSFRAVLFETEDQENTFGVRWPRKTEQKLITITCPEKDCGEKLYIDLDRAFILID